MHISVLGIPFNGDGTSPEVENPGQSLRDAGLVCLLASRAEAVVDLGDLTVPLCEGQRDPETGLLNLVAWQGVSADLARTVGEILAQDAFPLVLGGDCGILVGIVSALTLNDNRVGLIFLDGHADFHSPQTSPDGELADMELAVLTGHEPEIATKLVGRRSLLQERDVVVYGIRAPDLIASSDILVFDRQHLSVLGVKTAVTQGLERLEVDLPLWLSFDVDVLDPVVMPAVAFPEPNGLTTEEGEVFLEKVLASGRVIGMSVTCYHPNLDSDGRAGARLIGLIASALAGDNKR